MSDYLVSTRFACTRVDLEFLNQTKNIFRTHAIVKATPAQVFEVLEDPAAWVAWVTPLKSLEWTSPKPYGVGTTRTVTMQGGIDGYEEFVAWEAGKRMAFTFVACSSKLIEKLMEDYQVCDLGDGSCRVEWAMGFELRGFVRHLLWLVRPLLRFSQRRLLARFREYAEDYAENYAENYAQNYAENYSQNDAASHNMDFQESAMSSPGSNLGSDLVMASLEACTQDISDDVYRRFFADDSAAAELMGHSDQYMRGRMLQEVLQLLAAEDDEDYLTWEVRNHLLSYGVTTAMYSSFFAALQASVAAALEGQWTPAYAQAWEAKTAMLLADIERLETAADGQTASC